LEEALDLSFDRLLITMMISFYGILSYKGIYLELNEVDRFRMVHYFIILSASDKFLHVNSDPSCMQINSVRKKPLFTHRISLEIVEAFHDKK
jgi:hypothetical protein